MIMDRQEVFNTVYAHLLRQGVKSYSFTTGVCLYRGHGFDAEFRRTSCAIGCLIDDKHYSNLLEGRVVEHPMVIEALMASGLDINLIENHNFKLKYNLHHNAGLNSDLYFLLMLQSIHDHIGCEYWEKALVDFALERGLTIPG
jgi:hypothetical protein